MTSDAENPGITAVGTLAEPDLVDLERAVEDLEYPSLVARVASFVGAPVELVFDALPDGASDKIGRAVQASLRAALKVAVVTMRPGQRRRARPLLHKIAVGASGAGGGAFGLLALAVELPITTSIMLRSIADIARSEGEDLVGMEARLACLEVFALGGGSTADDATDSGYFAVRAALARAVSEAAEFIVRRGLIEESAPVIVRLLAQVTARFNTVVAEKIAAQGVPVIGAVGGSVINVLFMDHFQSIARAHFTVRRLERAHGAEVVRRAYDEIAARGN